MNPISAIAVQAMAGSGMDYARNLAKSLNLPLELVVPTVPVLMGRLVEDAATKQRENALSHFGEGQVGSVVDINSLMTSGSLLVTDREQARQRKIYPVIIPMNEIEPNLSLGGRILIPFGDGWAAVQAARLAFQLVRCFGEKAEVIFWHTTWRNPKVQNNNPGAHMLQAVLHNFIRLRDEAKALGVSAEFEVEFASSVPGGIVSAAYRHKCWLIAMARGKQVVSGGYPDEVLSISPIPVLMAPAQN